jgi:hypothetical protein
MKIRYILFVALLAGLLLAGTALAQDVEYPRASPKAAITQTVGTTTVTVNYCRPGVKGREIWGKLVPYGEVWRTGANEATTISFSDPVMVEGQKLDAGTYALFTIPTTGDWTVIFNKQAEQWGAYNYKPEMDVLRVTVKPMAHDPVEWMQFIFSGLSDTGATLELQWEKLCVPVKFTVDTPGKILAAATKSLARLWVQPLRAANYCLASGANLEQGLKWADQAAGIQENYNTLTVKAQLHGKLGQKAEAIAAMEKAIQMGKTQKQPPENLSDMEKMLAEWKQ